MKKIFIITLAAALIAFVSAGVKDEIATIYLIGDSTMADKPVDENPERGWGQMAPHFFNPEKAIIENHAVNGRSTKSFIDEGRWEKVVEKLKPNDYVFIQFGHNDQKSNDPSRYAAPRGDYRKNLIRFVQETRAKGAHPVLFTPVMRRRFDEKGRFYDTHGEYPEVVAEVGKEYKTPVVDLHGKTEALIRSHGVEGSKRLFLWVEPGVYDHMPGGKQDDTHFSAYGAARVAGLAVEGLRELNVGIARHTQNYRYAESPADRMLAFPGAEGYGRYTTGGRGGRAIAVANLNDDGPGSLREAIEAEGPRTIVFRVSGTIALESELEIKNGDVTIAGQSAPGDGICVRNYPVEIKADNVIIRYMRFRLGDEAKQADDAISGIRHKNIIIDHCSISWGMDECATFYDNENFTMQWCIVSESMSDSYHPKGKHGYGGIWGGMGATFHHNLLASHTSRNPRLCGARYHKQPEREIADLRNNVVYNWGHNSCYGGEQGNYNIVANYYKPGPATQDSRKSRIVNPSKPYGNFYVADNYVEGSEQVSADNWAGGVQADDADAARAGQPAPFVPIEQQSAKEAFELVLAHAGASLSRDAVDERVVREVRTGDSTMGNGKGIINSQKDVGGWPELKSIPAPDDSDKDGMPDKWEQKSGLNPKDGGDGSRYFLSKDFTNLEVYLNERVSTTGK